MRFQDLSLKRKLVLLTSSISLVSVVLCAAGFILVDYRTLRVNKVRQCRSIAQMLAFNSTAVVTFRESEAASALLAGLSGEPHVESAALFAADGTLVSRYDSTSKKHALPAFRLRSDVEFTAGNMLDVYQPVVEEGEVIGLVFIRSNLQQLQSQAYENVRVAAIVGAVALMSASLLAVIFQRVISRPVLMLTRTAKAIRDDGNYKTRVRRSAKDELGILFSAFNSMLQRIEESENQLRAYNDDLEARVSRRTSELEHEIRKHEETAKSLIEAKESAEKASRVKSDFLANVSHEIRTPMNAILGFTELLKRAEADGDVDATTRTEYLETIHSSGQHLLGLINDILDISKIEAGKLAIERIAYSPHQVVSEVVSIMRVQAEEKGIGLEYAWVGKVPATIQSDPARFRQVVINLIGNAIKFTHQGQVDVVLQLMDPEDAPAALRVDVKDTGIGIEQDQLERIFAPFTQADTSTTRRFGGTGLGLTICRKIAEALGGELVVQSEIGKGSVFSFTLDPGPITDAALLSAPLGDILPADDDTDVTEPAELPSAARVLVVEDGVVNRKLVMRILSKAGMQVTCAENGKIGAELALGEHFDVVLMDMQMPVMDGYTATSLLRQHGCDVPIIALTAHAMSGDRDKCLQAGCTDFLTKPIAPDRLLATLTKWLGDVATACHTDGRTDR